MKRAKQVLVGIALAGAMAGAVALPQVALADPVNQPSNGSNCHGVAVAQTASAEPEGLGNILGGQLVREFQQEVRAICELVSQP